MNREQQINAKAFEIAVSFLKLEMDALERDDDYNFNASNIATLYHLEEVARNIYNNIENGNY